MEIILLNFVESLFEGQGLRFLSGILVFIPGVRGAMASADWGRLAALALQFLLCPPGAARRALRAGMGRGVEYLFKAASAVVRPAYFRLKGQTHKRVVHFCHVFIALIIFKFSNTFFFSFLERVSKRCKEVSLV